MRVGVEVEKISGRMHRNHGTAHCAIFLYSGQVEVSYGLVSAGAEASQEVAIISEGPPQHLRDGEGPVPYLCDIRIM
jgi:hypothetical protein